MPANRIKKQGEKSLPQLQKRSGMPLRASRCDVPASRRSQTAATKVALRKEFRVWQESLPSALERDTLLVPEWIAENVVHEAERFLNARLPEDFTARLAAKAEHLYPRHAHFKKQLNRPGNRGRDNLRMYMRHWTCAWLKREHRALYKKLPWSYALGTRLGLKAQD